MSDKLMDRVSTSVAIKEMQIKTTVSYQFIPTKRAVIKKTVTSSALWYMPVIPDFRSQEQADCVPHSETCLQKT
jgi:hypothetical protein